MMREMQRGNDRAMQNIETIPGGFNHLRRMYTDIQEPMMDASLEQARSMQGQGGAAQSQYASLLEQNPPPQSAPNTSALPNPWLPASQQVPQSTAPATQPSQPGQQPQQPGQPQANPFASLFGAPPAGQADANPFAATGVPPATAANMLNDPFMRQMMQTLMSNPDFVEQMMTQNPQMRQMLEENPEMRARLRDPAFLQTLSDPNTLQAMMQFQSTLQQAG